MAWIEEKLKEIFKGVNLIKYCKYTIIANAIMCLISVALIVKCGGYKQYFDMYCNHLDTVLLLVALVESACIVLAKEKDTNK